MTSGMVRLSVYQEVCIALMWVELHPGRGGSAPLPKRSDLITVVIPCHNAAATLDAAIESVRAQDGIRLDVVVIDDGSTDTSPVIARRFDPAVRVIVDTHRGASAARNPGIAESGGEWLVFLDADDLLLPETPGKRLDAALATGTEVVACG